MKKLIIFSLVALLGIFTACNEGNAATKVDLVKLEAAKKRDIDISKGNQIIPQKQTGHRAKPADEQHLPQTPPR